jgi:hypothetical protein
MRASPKNRKDQTAARRWHVLVKVPMSQRMAKRIDLACTRYGFSNREAFIRSVLHWAMEEVS